MPNWFYFTLEVSGKKEDIESFMDNVQGSEKYESEEQKFDFNHFIPQPENIFRGNLGIEEQSGARQTRYLLGTIGIQTIGVLNGTRLLMIESMNTRYREGILF